LGLYAVWVLEFLYIKEPQLDKHTISLVDSATKQSYGFLTFVVPSQETLCNMENQKVSTRFIEWWKRECQHKPYVDYSFVEESQRKNGYGKLLYKEAAKYLKQNFGYRLYRSGNQSKEAKALWASLKKNSSHLDFIVTEDYIEASI
jgi:GNAT superfamily N-acetyltransferase